MIKRSNPDIGYLAEDLFTNLAFTQSIRAGNTLYVSGVAPFTGDAENMELVGAGDLNKQVEWVLEVIRRTLADEGATFENWVAQTVYTTDIEALKKTAHIFREAYGSNGPTSTWVEIKGLFVPEQMIEINGIAVLE